MVQAEYNRFLQTLDDEEVTDEVRKMAAIVLDNLETLIPLTTAKGQRIKKMVELAQATWDSTSLDLQAIEEHVAEQNHNLNKIKSLSVGPFRGFGKQEDFDLGNQLVLIYGPNGTGKSSFCEALEYCLLNNVVEAESKRFRNHDYLKNAYTNSFTPPILTGTDNKGNTVPIYPNESLFRFCFVEKNRIDAFSRIAAQTPARQSELISTLFGLDAFSEFVQNFTDSMDRYIDLDGVKAKELDQKTQALVGFKQQLESIVPDGLQRLDEDEKALAEKFQAGYTFLQMVTIIMGTEEEKGLITKLKKELQKPIDQKSNIKLSDLKSLRHSIETNIYDLNIKQEQLANADQEISFKRLYETVIEVQKNSPDQCPACHTPLSRVIVNPFEHADTELKKLHYLGELEESAKELNDDITTALKEISKIINICFSRLLKNNYPTVLCVAEDKVTIDWWNRLHQEKSEGYTAWQYVEDLVKDLEDMDKEITHMIKTRTEKEGELTRLDTFNTEIVKLQTRREEIGIMRKQAKEAIGKLDAENAQLISDVEKEKDIIEQNQIIAKAYATFVHKLNDYKNALPAKLVARLGETVVQLYNAFNRHDGEHEQLAKIRLPLQQNQKLEISFSIDPNSFFDALHILSEGHIRCIGLAILAAKNIKEGCPFLIFDDPINAIDDDHRESIRRTIFEDLYFKDKQIILACHGEEFFKDIQNLLSAEQARSIKLVSFLPKRDNDIHVDHNCSPRNYIIAARGHLSKNEKRDALSKSRKALESLTKGKVWPYVSKFGDGNLSIKLRSAKSAIELRNLTEQLRKQIEKPDFSNQDKDAVLKPIDSLLGIDGNSREWRYLNKGAHEESDRAEFDQHTVNWIVQLLEELDTALATPR